MHPAYSVIFFTTASGAGYGLLAMLGLGAAFGVVFPQSIWFCLVALGLSLGLITLGLLSSTFHLGHPERAWRAFSQWRSSWLSREGVAAVATYVPAGLFGLLWLGGFDGGPVWKLLGVLSAVAATITVWCTGMIYGCLTTIRQWNNPLVAPIYMALSAATGLVLFALLMQGFGAGQSWHVVLAIAALVVAAALKLIYWRGIDQAPRDLTIGDATGLGRLGTVRQFEAPHTQSNFVQREMGFKVARKHASKLRRLCLLVGFAGCLAACVLALLLPGAGTMVFLVIATAAAGFAVVVERWLFFAEAEHVVNLFYGTERA
ncbi:MAG: dimethyl sulfoxide reductase anchor subunit [Alphaproteobacteria bacterium]|nr:dimethyl sulfoxide reductase anchor subunit [Alphaproteobacteria bacterium]